MASGFTIASSTVSVGALHSTFPHRSKPRRALLRFSLLPACIAGPGTQDRCWIASGESAGFCGCSSAAACGTDTAHPGTRLVCERVR